MLWEHRNFTLSGDKAGHDLLWVPSAHRDGSLSHDGDVQLKIEDVAVRQFFSRKVPGSPFGFPNLVLALQKSVFSLQMIRYWASLEKETAL